MGQNQSKLPKEELVPKNEINKAETLEELENRLNKYLSEESILLMEKYEHRKALRQDYQTLGGNSEGAAEQLLYDFEKLAVWN